MGEDLVEGFELSRVHKGSALGDVSQGGGLELAHEFLPLRLHKAQFGTLLRFGVAVGTQTVEFVSEHLLGTQRTPGVFRKRWNRGYAGVVKIVVGKKG